MRKGAIENYLEGTDYGKGYTQKTAGSEIAWLALELALANSWRKGEKLDGRANGYGYGFKVRTRTSFSVSRAQRNSGEAAFESAVLP
jgi:hypothetical protein